MDKSWIDSQSKTDVYLRGIDAFLEYAFRNRSNDSTICCPCVKCVNRHFKGRRDVRDDCFINGFSRNYKNWIYHGEMYEPINRHGDTVFHEMMNQIEKLRITSGDTLPEDIITLSRGPYDWGKRHKACVVHGFRFRVKSLDARKKTQNSGVFCGAYTSCYASSKDKRPQTGVVQYYGVLTDIIQIQYSSSLKYNMFKCDWINNEKGLKIDKFKFTLVNFNHVMYTGNEYLNEPYIFSTQAEQVWYVDEPLEQDWKVVVKMNRRDNFEIYSWERQAQMHSSFELDDRPIFGDNNWIREGVEAVEVDDNDDEDVIHDE